MRAHGQSYIKRIGERQPDKGSARRESGRGLVSLRQRHEKHLALSFQPDSRWLAYVGLDFVRRSARCFAKLQRRKPVSMHRHVNIRRTRAKRLPDHQAGFPMRVAATAEKSDGGLQGEVA